MKNPNFTELKYLENKIKYYGASVDKCLVVNIQNNEIKTQKFVRCVFRTLFATKENADIKSISSFDHQSK